MDKINLLKSNEHKEDLVRKIKDRIIEFNNDLFKSSVITVVSNTERRKIYGLFTDYYIFHLSDVSFYDLATNKKIKDEQILTLNSFVKGKLNFEPSCRLLELSTDYIESIINIIKFKTVIMWHKIKYKSNYKDHLYAYILGDDKAFKETDIKRKLAIEKYIFVERNNIKGNNFKTDIVYLELIKLINFYKITPSANEVFNYINHVVNASKLKKLYVELPVFEEDEDLYPFLKITYPEDTVFTAENIPLFLNIGRALSSLKDIEINVIVPRVDKERELDFVKRLLTNNHEHKMIFHIMHPYFLSFKSIEFIKGYKTLILDFTQCEAENALELYEEINEYKKSIKDVRDFLIYKREVCIKTNFLDDEKIINYFINRGYRTLFFDGKSNQKQMIEKIADIKNRRKTLKVTY